MLSLEDVRWSEMTGGYRLLLDPRPMLKRLETERDTSMVWQELWDELHHQGDVGEASFAAVPYLVKAYRERGVVDWNTFAIVAIIELARKEGKNPDVPGWLEEGYFTAIRELAKIGATDIFRATSPADVRAILSVLAIERGQRTLAPRYRSQPCCSPSKVERSRWPLWPLGAALGHDVSHSSAHVPEMKQE